VFWKIYPKKVGKDAAWRAWKYRNGSLPGIQIIIEAIKAQSQSEQWRKDNGQYIPNPSTWINQGRWEDEPIKVSPYQKGRVDAGERDVRDYKPEPLPDISEEERQRNLDKIKQFTQGIGRAGP
jgi:hypothetical protein